MNREGLLLRKTKILAWTEDWGKSYSQEEKILKEVFRDELVDIFHIGSTSIPTIGYAKRRLRDTHLYNG